jgi:hypothetical protein
VVFSDSLLLLQATIKPAIAIIAINFFIVHCFLMLKIRANVMFDSRYCKKYAKVF